MNTIVISQPMFFPWIGLFEQVKLADNFIHFDDVQLPQGRSFVNRVQIKTKDGSKWLTVPLKKAPSASAINTVQISYEANWPDTHLKFLDSNYKKAPYRDEMLQIVEAAYTQKFELVSDLSKYSIESISGYFGLNTKFYSAAPYKLQTHKSERLLDLIAAFNGTKYITGWGALNYLDYDLFERRGVSVEYIDYKKIPYRQDYGSFDPFVSVLDLIAYEGKSGRNFMQSNSLNWKTFIHERSRAV